MKKSRLIVLMILGFSLSFTSCDPPAVEALVEEGAVAKKVAVLVDEGFHDGEAFMPIGYLTNRGAKVTVIGPEKGIVKAYNSDFTIKIQKSISDVSVDDFDALILPGGRAPALLRENEKVVEFTKAFFESGKITAAICHGPQVLVKAGVLEGLKSTSFAGIQKEMEAAGALFRDTSVVVDGNLITSRIPVDLNDFCKNIEKALF